MDKRFTKADYRKYVEAKAPKTRVASNAARAFVVGGLICMVGQFLFIFFKQKGLDTDSVSALTALVMVFLGAFLTGLNIYDDLGRFAGAGSIVPITGFANSVVSPAMEFKSEGYVMGVGAKMFNIAGPVLVYGISASVIAGIIYYLLK